VARRPSMRLCELACVHGVCMPPDSCITRSGPITSHARRAVVQAIATSLAERTELMRNPSFAAAYGSPSGSVDAAAVALRQLRASARWCVTGTPVHNSELDLYSTRAPSAAECLSAPFSAHGFGLLLTRGSQCPACARAHALSPLRSLSLSLSGPTGPLPLALCRFLRLCNRGPSGLRRRRPLCIPSLRAIRRRRRLQAHAHAEEGRLPRSPHGAPRGTPAEYTHQYHRMLSTPSLRSSL
jgi:hypothetical protein